MEFIKKSLYRPDIDGLRGFAVITVIINHFDKEILPQGYLGVDIFFVISGFVITSSLYQRSSKNFYDFISSFFERRIKRIVPALLFFVILFSIAICLFNPSPMLSLRTGASSLVGLSNLYLLRQSTDYFAQSTDLNVFTHTWSLGVEEQFYIFFPFLVWFSGFGRNTKNGIRNLFLVIGILSIVSLISFFYLYHTNQPAAYFLMPSRLWEMAAGCLTFIGIQKSKVFKELIIKVPSLLLFTIIALIMFLPNNWGSISTFVVVFITSVLIASLRENTTAFRIVTHPILINMGLISYSLYLYHWGILSISRWTIGIHWWSIPFQIILIFVFARYSYKWIETPLRKKIWFVQRSKLLVSSGGLLALFSGSLVVLNKPFQENFYTGAKSNIVQPYDLVGEFTGRFAKNCHTSDSGKYALKGSNFITQSFLDNCLSAKSKKPLIAFSGDSHALTFFPISENISNSKKYNVLSHSRDGCAFPPQGETSRKNCFEVQTSFIDRLLNEIKKRDSGSVVVAVSYLDSHFGYDGDHRKNFKKYPKGSKKHVENNLKEFIYSVEKLSIKLKKQKASLIIVAPLPNHPGFIAEIATMQWFRPKISISDQKTSRNYLQKQQKHIVEAIKEITYKNDNIYLFNPFKNLCDTKYCYASKNGKFFFTDDNHLSIDGANIISKDLFSLIQKININQEK